MVWDNWAGERSMSIWQTREGVFIKSFSLKTAHSSGNWFFMFQLLAWLRKSLQMQKALNRQQTSKITLTSNFFSLPSSVRKAAEVKVFQCMHYSYLQNISRVGQMKVRRSSERPFDYKLQAYECKSILIQRDVQEICWWIGYELWLCKQLALFVLCSLQKLNSNFSRIQTCRASLLIDSPALSTMPE